MSASPLHPDHATPSELSRRRLLTGGLAAGGALTAGAALAASGVAAAEDDGFGSPGKALENARRMSLEPETPAEAGTPGVPGAPAADEILFPIVVDEDDSCYVLDNFGDCRGNGCSRSHEGVDIMADQGLPVRAVEAGVLTNRYEDSGKSFGAGHGWTLLATDSNVTWKFFHLDSHEEGLEVGDEVEYGQIIGYVGNTGTSGIGTDSNYHLHFEYRPDNIARDSFDRLQRTPFIDFAGE